MNSNLIASSATSDKIQARELTASEIEEIEHEKTLYPDKQAVGLEALKIVQKHQGWVSDESLLAISRYLDIPVSELEGVATFFNLVFRRPVGKHVMLFCDSVSCWIMGCENIRAHISQKLGIDYGETTADGEFTLLPVPCLGDCDRAPVMMVDENQHRNLTAEKVDAIIQQYRNNEPGEQGS
ncbi:MAG: NADH-quinone oxidoreductase subunit NuoE [Gammaproteobacteria bacterium]|nr:NADH-quinone oxidoreductase subunit NuoE [Pseudomonadales bacterium]MCP5346038.1 NADH-quinone oxidoreductase subunit NuoE [Pseudomonadales bacterium]